MPKFFANKEQVEENVVRIEGQDVNHIKNVLRYEIGDSIVVCIEEVNYSCRINRFDKNEIICDIIEKIEKETESNVNITIFQGLPKADKMELIIQKGTELGVNEFVPVKMDRCIVKLDGKDEIKKIERWRKIAEVAAKQSGRNIIPKINNVNNIEKVCQLIKKYDIVLVTYENEHCNYLKPILEKLPKNSTYNIGVLVGPEGGISEKEVQLLEDNGAKVVSLGNRILRTETVCLAISSIIMYELGDMGEI